MVPQEQLLGFRLDQIVTCAITIASERCNAVNASAVVEARVGFALVYVVLTKPPFESVVTDADWRLKYIKTILVTTYSSELK